MLIGGWQRCSFVDYPGELACVVFTHGCNLRCPWCHNPDLVVGRSPPDPAEAERELLDFLRHRRHLLTAVVVSGGEPTLQRDLLIFLQQIKELGYFVKLDTNGTRPDHLNAAVSSGLIDYLAMDLKLPPTAYSELRSGRQRLGRVPAAEWAGAVRDSIQIIQQSGVEHEFRTTLVEGIHTAAVLDQLADELPPGSRWYLQDLCTDRMLAPDPSLRPVGEDRARHWAKHLSERGFDCHLRSAVAVN